PKEAVGSDATTAPEVTACCRLEANSGSEAASYPRKRADNASSGSIELTGKYNGRNATGINCPAVSRSVTSRAANPRSRIDWRKVSSSSGDILVRKRIDPI